VTELQDNIFTDTTAMISIIIGTLGFLSAIATLVFTILNNNRNFKLQSDKNEIEKSKAYNRILGNLLKVYHSYVKHKMLFAENGLENVPDYVLIQLIDKIDNFDTEIQKFKRVAENESEIIPELTFEIHDLLDILGRFEMISEHIKSPEFENGPPERILIVRRSHTFAVQEILDEYFSSLITDLSKKADVDEEFQEALDKFNSSESLEKIVELQKNIFDRLLASLSRQIGEEIKLDDVWAE
jgi:hypothetical protein